MYCDVLVALRNSTRDNSIIFAKNSDRDMNECQQIRYFPHLIHKEKLIKCTFIEIPQVSETYEVLLVCPYWLWGAEMGVNECGVTIGNVAVRSKEIIMERGKGLTGMDMIRIALERSPSAYDAMRIIINLIQKYPQSLYHNSFIIADTKEAWVLETAGKYWVAKKVKDVYSISNTYTIECEWDEAHPELIKHALDMKWCNSEEEFNFAKIYADFNVEYMKKAQIRLKRTRNLLEEKKGSIDLKYVMKIMRDHGVNTLIEPRWSRNEQFFNTICVHRERGETAASMIVELFDEENVLLKTTCWALLSSPCTSVYFPLFLGGTYIPEGLNFGSNVYDEKSIWWLFEKIQRLVDLNYKPLAPIVRSIWDYVEEIEISEVKLLRLKLRSLLNENKFELFRNIINDFVRNNFERILTIAREIEKIIIQLNKILPKYYNLRKDIILKASEEANLPLP